MAEARYDAVADFYERIAGGDAADPAAVGLLDLVGDPFGLAVLDLACGHGRISRELARRGASVVGADLSGALLATARRLDRVEQLGIRYIHQDAALPAAFPNEIFDAVVSHLGLSDIDDLDGLLATVARVLRPGGRFVFSILHPCFPGFGDDAPSSWPPGRGYFAEGWWLADNTGFRGKVGANHRTVSRYLNQLIATGLAIDELAEPQPAGDWIEANPQGEPVPVYLVVACPEELAGSNLRRRASTRPARAPARGRRRAGSRP